jgi:hypothetical protein
MLEQFFIKRKLKVYARKLRRRLAETDAGRQNYITEPILNCDALGQVGGLPLLSWLYFNPMGPTSCGLFFVPIPGKDEGIVAFNMQNPFLREWAAFGVIPNQVAGESLPAALVGLFAENGHESCRLLGGLPSSICHADNWELDTTPPWIDEGQARILFRFAAQSMKGIDLKMTSEYLRRYKGDPWARTAAELDEGLLKSLIRLDEVESEFDREQFNEWFDLVTDATHIRLEQKNFQSAWQGAIEHAASRR